LTALLRSRGEQSVRSEHASAQPAENARRIEMQIVAGDIAGAISGLSAWRADASDDPASLGTLVLLYTRLGR